MGLGIEQIIGDKRDEILRLAAQYGVRDVRIFGSVLRGEATEDSDIDFLVSLRDTDYWRQCDFWYGLEDLLGRKIDIVSDRALDKYIGPYILKEARPL
jgi:hypothetical protein